MAIVVKSKKIKEDIVDENGQILGSISYNPNDTTTYTKLTDIMNNLLKISDEMKSLQHIKNIPEEGLKSMEDFENYRDDFNAMNISLHNCDEKIENIKHSIDLIFGEGVCNIIMEGSNDVEMLIPLIEEVIPKFKNARDGKVNKYLPTESEILDVMD